MTNVPQHLLMIAPVRNLKGNSRIISTINEYCQAGSRVSVVCSPQPEDNGPDLSQILHQSATVYPVPEHLPEGECYDLSQFLGRSFSSTRQRLSSFLLTTGLNRQWHRSVANWPCGLRRPLQFLFDAWYHKVNNVRQKALADGRYWLHYLSLQLPPTMYRKYEKTIQLDCYGYFYFIRSLLINKSVEPIDAVYCHYLWALPVGCLLKELINVPLIYDSHMSRIDDMENSNNRKIFKENEKWIYKSCDRIISVWEQTVKGDDWISFKRSNNLSQKSSQLKIAVLYDEASMHVGTIYEHLNSFRKYLPHQVSFFSATACSAIENDYSKDDLSQFDVVIVHYGVRLSISNHIDAKLAEQVTRFRGLKILFIQDEYETTETARKWMDKLQFDVVYTLVPEESHEFVFPSTRFPKTVFIRTQAGFVPEDSHIDKFAMPLAERNLVIAYRGRILPYYYGALGYEKYEIGIEVRRLAEERGIRIDIEVADDKRIYGDHWYRFLGSARATLGTESGSNIFDFDGHFKEAVNQALTENPKLTFHDIYPNLLAEHDGIVKMNQVSPKMFEAIRLRTALVQFEGLYSGILKPDLHFIPLKKDYSNIDEVFAKLDDLDYLQELTERAYRDIIESGRYSYQRFIEGIAADIEERVAQVSAIS